MNIIVPVIIMVISSFLAAFGQLSLKIGSMKLQKKLSDVFKNFAFMAGILFYGLSTVLTIVALKGAELSVIYPLASLNYVWVSLLSATYLKEKVNAYKIAGIALIIIGVVLVL
ncbi:MAG TPA: EamA family transporter [Candidatus Nanoarchaeia archaeon]|nr:EamA family transporter [Candidatus Nanoarchaeia archaeon]